jgi:L-threonylcarbamoyladenylate synthase
MPRVLSVDAAHPDPAVIAEARDVLLRGGLVAFPTETVYGLGARGLDAKAVEKIFRAKGRPSGHPVILHVDGDAMARTLSASWSELASRFARTFWPGPLTLVVPRAACVPREVTGGLDAVGLRSPAHAVARALITAVGEPLAAPSANAHTHVSPTTAEHVVRSLGDRVELVLDAGPSAVGIESTVLALSEDPPRVLRPGGVSLDALRAIDPRVVHEVVSLETEAPRAAPGMAAKHYAPRARVVLAESGGKSVADAIARESVAEVAALVMTEDARDAASGARFLVQLPSEPEGYAQRLFAALHAAEAASVDVIVIEGVPRDRAWWAIRDRLSRAAKP